ncbi:Hsp70 family protein [Arthrobacter sp. Z4-13]
MSYVLAIDIGTSFTAAAIARFDQGSSPAPECLPLGVRGTSVPSVIYYPEDGPILVGEAAERRGLDSPARVVREFKRRVGDSVPISVGALSLPPEDVFATVARWVADRAEEREGAPPSEIVLTHPAAWGSHRTSVILAAMAAKSLENVTLITEPEAAAVYYASQVRVEDGSTIAVYDLGGGTFDTAVLRKAGSSRFELVGRPEGIENLGGADFDAEVFRYVAEHTAGALSKLNQADAGVRGALARLRRECVEAKEALSVDSEANISVLLPGIQQQVRLVRSDFEALIEDPVRDTVDALEQSLAEMELEREDLSAVLLIGGSSRIPLVAQLISEQLDRPIAVDADPKSSICMGAAVSALLARAELSEAKEATPEVGPGAAPVEAGLTAVGLLAAAGHLPGRRASWSRKGATAAGAAGAAAGATHEHAHGGAHAPRPAVRLTSIAAAAALVSVLTATAAQSPGGLGSLTSAFGQEARADPGTGSAPGGSGVPAAGSGPGPETAVAGGAPMAGIEAGLDTHAAPTSSPSSSAALGTSQAVAGSTGGAAAGSGTGAPAGTGGGTTGGAAGKGAAGATPDSTGTPGTGPVTGEPVVGGTPSPVVGGGTLPPVVGGGTPPPVEGGGTPPPVEGGGTPPPVEGGGTPPPVEGGGTPPPVEGGGTPPPVEGGGTPPPVEGGGTPPPVEGGGTPPPTDPVPVVTVAAPVAGPTSTQPAVPVSATPITTEPAV